MNHVAGTTPYPWPYDGRLDITTDHLVVCGWDAYWMTATSPTAEVLANIERLAAVFDHVVAISHYLPHTTMSPPAGVAAPPPPLAATCVAAHGIDGYYASPLDAILRRRHVERIVLAGLGLETTVHSTLRTANDMGIECLVVVDACAPLDSSLVARSVSMIEMSGGIFGAVGTTGNVCTALRSAINHPPKRRGSPVTIHPAIDAANPYPWPYDGEIDTNCVALVNIDWQTDFCGPGGYVDAMGYDLALTRAGLAPTAAVIAAARAAGILVIHTREGHKPDLTDLPANKLWRSQRIGGGIGERGPCGRILIRGEQGWDIVPEVYPVEGEPIIDKPGKGAFYATDLDLVLRTNGITHIVLTGITTDVCVHTTIREANDRGYECLLLSDCTGATDYGNYEAALKMITMQGGVFGAHVESPAFLRALAS